MTSETRIKTERFYLRDLTESDASSRYLSWLQDSESSQYILHTQEDIKTLQQYINDNFIANDVLFLGVFCGKTHQHIGNIKYDHIGSLDQQHQSPYAVMGILIGEKSWRGKGVAQEIIPATLTYLKTALQIERVYLGVTQANEIAINAYKKIGFVEEKSPPFVLDAKGIAMSIVIS